jgi:integrase
LSNSISINLLGISIYKIYNIQSGVPMPSMRRFKTDYLGVFYIMGKAVATGKPEKIFMIRYRKDGRLIEEKAGRQFQDNMTAAKAARLRAERIEGKSLSNKARREEKARQNEIREWTIKRLWKEYIDTKPQTKGFIVDDQRFKNHLEPVLGNKRLEDLDPLSLDRLRVNLLKTKAPQTVKSIMALLKRISNFARNKRLCKGIDFKIILPKVFNIKTEFLTEDQLKALFKAIDEDPHPYAGPLMRMALFTGMRRGELFKLTWDDVDLERDFIRIRNPKGGVDQTIPLNENARGVLMALPKTDSPFVFPGRHGGEMIDINHRIKTIKEKAGLPKEFRALHGLRHTYASMLASSGKVDLYVLQKLLTHKNPIMTQRYAHLRDEALKKASALAGELMNGALKEDKEETKVVPLG